MADERIVMDAGPLILMAKIDALGVLTELPFRYIAPPSVRRELVVGPVFGHPPVDAPWLEVCELREPLPAYARMTLDEGEAAVIQLALEQGIRVVCLDDLRGRRLAKALGLEVVGLLGLLTRAKRMGIIDALQPYTEKLVAAGARYSPKLLQEVLINVEEQSRNNVIR